jgi:hypothetical protein
MTEALAILRALDALASLYVNAGGNLAKWQAMRQANGGNLSDEDLAELAEQAHESVRRLG